MNRFYELNIVFQWIISLLMAALAIAVIVYFYELWDVSIWYALTIFIVVPIGQFLVTPFMKLVGVYTYLSPMLLVFGKNKKKYDLHNGTSFDYFFVFAFSNSKMDNFQNRMLTFYMNGLLEIIRKIEAGELEEEVVVRGSSYFFSEKTAKRLGFQVKTAGIAEKLNIFFNYLDLLWMYSLSRGKLSFPNLREIKTATTLGSELVKKKSKILATKQFLEGRISENERR